MNWMRLKTNKKMCGWAWAGLGPGFSFQSNGRPKHGNERKRKEGWMKKRLRISLRFFDLEASDEKKKKCALSSQIEKEMSICWL